jgi:hypothetical protein
MALAKSVMTILFTADPLRGSFLLLATSTSRHPNAPATFDAAPFQSAG